MNKIILVDLVDLVALGFLFGPQDILGQKGPLEYINVNYIPENCLKATRAILGHAGSILGNLRSFEAMLKLFWTPMDGPI